MMNIIREGCLPVWIKGITFWFSLFLEHNYLTVTASYSICICIYNM